MRGLFITLEGGDGSGKSTQLARLAGRLSRLGIEPLITREPGGTPLAERVRELLLHPGLDPTPLSEASLIEAARADLVTRVIAPALTAGRLVICDRHTDSTLAYQGYGRGLDLELLRAWNRAAASGLTPDLTLLFDLDPAAAIDRRVSGSGETNRIDREPLEFHLRVRRGFLELARAEPQRIVVLDAERDPERVEAQAWESIGPRIDRLRGRAQSGETRPR